MGVVQAAPALPLRGCMAERGPGRLVCHSAVQCVPCRCTHLRWWVGEAQLGPHLCPKLAYVPPNARRRLTNGCNKARARLLLRLRRRRRPCGVVRRAPRCARRRRRRAGGVARRAGHVLCLLPAKHAAHGLERAADLLGTHRLSLQRKQANGREATELRTNRTEKLNAWCAGREQRLHAVQTGVFSETAGQHAR